MSKHRVFLSYASPDQEFAAAVRRELGQFGISTYDPDTAIKPGEDWRSSVKKGIRESDAVVVLITDPSLAASSWIGYEVGSATALGKDVVVMKPSTFSASDLPTDLSGARVFDFEPLSASSLAKTLVSRLAPA